MSNYETDDFGLSKAKRIQAFSKAHNEWSVKESKPTHRLLIKNKLEHLPILCIHQSVPKYRLENGRTASAQDEYIALHDKDKNFFLDGENLEAQVAQHELLLELSFKSDLRKKFEDPKNHQIDPILLDHEGFVLNGNRRLATWRHLYINDPLKYMGFEYIDVVVLPPLEEEDLDKIEAALQIEKDIKADYTWDAEANMMLSKMKSHGNERGYTINDLALLYSKKESEIQELLDMRKYANEWLESRNKNNQWSQVSKSELAFRAIVNCRHKVGSDGRKQLFKEAAFVLIDNPDETRDSLHDAINDLAKNFDPIVQNLGESFEVSSSVSDSEAVQDDLFGQVPISKLKEVNELVLSVEISKPENKKLARQVIVDFIESQKLKKREAKSADNLLFSCKKANSLLEDAIKLGINSDTNTKGVDIQLDELENRIRKIRDLLGS